MSRLQSLLCVSITCVNRGSLFLLNLKLEENNLWSYYTFTVSNFLIHHVLHVYALNEINIDRADIIYGPLKVVPLKSDKLKISDYEKAVEHFNVVKSLDRHSIL